jgi:outer membrane protein assembly factor BamB
MEAVMDKWKKAIQKLQSDLSRGDPETVEAFLQILEQYLSDGVHFHGLEAQEINPALQNLDLNLDLDLRREGQSFVNFSMMINGNMPMSDSLARCFRMRQEHSLTTSASQCLTEGKLKWSATASRYRDAANGFACFATPELDYLVCVETNSGKEVWKRGLKSPIAAYPAMSDTAVFYGDFDKMLYAVDLRGGQEIWTLQMDHRIVTPGTVDGGRLWFGNCDGRFRSIDIANPGRINTLDVEVFPADAPTVSEGLACVDCNTSFIVVDSTTAKQVWAPVLSKRLLFSPTIHRGKVYCHTVDEFLRALDVETRKEIWNSPLHHSLGSVIVPGGGMIFCRYMENQIRAFDATTGEVRWTFNSEQDGISSPAYSDGLVFAFGATGFCLKAETGEPVWRFALSSKEIKEEDKKDYLWELAFHAPLCDSDTAFFNDDKGNLLAVGND